MFGDGEGSGTTYLLEMVKREDMVCDGCLGEEYCFLFFNGGGKSGRGGGKVEIVE